MGEAPVLESEGERLQLLDELDIMDTEPDEAFDALTQMAADMCGTPISLVSLVNSARQWFKSRQGLDATETPREVAFCAHAIASDDAVMEVPNALEDARFADNPLVIDDPNIRFYAGVPLRPTGTHAVGTLCVIDREPRQLSASQRKGLLRLGMIAEQQLRLRLAVSREAQATEQAAENEKKYRYLAENLADAVVVHDRDLVIKFFSPSAPAFLGNAPDEEITEKIIRMHPEDHPSFLAVLDTLTEDQPTTHFEVRIDAGYSGYIYAGVHTRAIFEDGVVAEYHTSLRDVTELHDYRVELERANQELQAAAAERNLLIRGVAHDLSAPLAALRLSAESMTMLLQEEPALVELGRRLHGLSVEAEALVSDLLSVAEPGTQRPLQRSNIDLAVVVRRCVETIGSEAAIATDLEAVNVYADPQALGRVVTNLLTNALKHCPRDTPMTVLVRAEDDDAIIQVLDRGPGIPASERRRVLEPYQRNVEADGVEGSGLGLTIADSLVRAHGGRLTISGTEPCGTTVTVRLPLDHTLN